MTYVLATGICRIQNLTVQPGTVVYEPGHSAALLEWVQQETAEELTHPTAEQRRQALAPDGTLAHAPEDADDG